MVKIVRAYVHCHDHCHHCKSSIQSQMIWATGPSLPDKVYRNLTARQCQLTLSFFALCTPFVVAGWFCMWFGSQSTAAWWLHLLRRRKEEDLLLWFEEDRLCVSLCRWVLLSVFIGFNVENSCSTWESAKGRLKTSWLSRRTFGH